MEIIYGGRGSGKTYLLVQALKRNKKAVLVTFNQRERMRIINEYELKEDQVLIFDSIYTGQHRGLNIKALFVDNLELCLHSFFNLPITMVTLNEPPTIIPIQPPIPY